MSPRDLRERSPCRAKVALGIASFKLAVNTSDVRSGQNTTSPAGLPLLLGSESALAAMGPQPASMPVEARGALPLLSRLAPLHSAAVAAQWHQATCLSIKSSTVLAISASVPAARRKRQHDGLMAVSSAGKQGGAVGGQLWLCRHSTACPTSTACRRSCQSPGGSSGSKD